MIISAGPNFARTGVVAGFTMSIDTNLVSLTKGVLFAQSTIYRPSSAPGSAITQPATTGINWLFYNSTTGWYWQTSITPANSGDAFLGWALRDSSGNILAVSRQLVTVPDEDGTGAPVVIPLGSVLGAEDELPPTPATNTSTIETDTIGGIPSYRFHVATSSGGGSTSGFVAQVRFYSDSGATTPISDWIDIGWLPVTATTLDTDWWPLSDTQEYAKVRVAAQNSGNALSAWLQGAILTKPASTGLGIWVADPVIPTACSVTVLENGDNFGLRTEWTPATSYGGTVGYEREVRYYSDSGASTPISDWVPLGAIYGPTTATADSGFWPKPASVQYVRLRVRAYASDGAVTDWLNSSTPLPSVPASSISIQDAVAPTSPTITVLTQDGNFGLRTAWTEAGDPGGTVGYDREVRYYSDSGASTPVSDWIPLGSVGVGVATADSGWWPKPTSAEYVRFRVRAYNGLGSPTSWVYSSTPIPAVPIAASALLDPAAPTSPTITVLTQDGNFGLRTAWTEAGSLGGTVGYDREVRYYSDSGASTAISDWIPLGAVRAGIATADSGWWPNPSTTQYVRFRVRAFNGLGTPTSWVLSATPLPSVSVLAVPPVVAGNSSAVQTVTRAGVPSYRFHVAITEATDKGTTRQYLAQARFYSDSGASTPTSDWITLGSFAVASTVMDTDYWPCPTSTAYAKVRVAGQNSDNNFGPWLESSVLTVTASSGVTAAQMNNVVKGTTTAKLNTTDGFEVTNSQYGYATTLNGGYLYCKDEYNHYAIVNPYSFGAVYGTSSIDLKCYNTTVWLKMTVSETLKVEINAAATTPYINVAGEYRVNGTTVIDSNRCGHFSEVYIGSGAVIGSDRCAYFTGLYIGGSVCITSTSDWLGTAIRIAYGGTGQTTASGALAALGGQATYGYVTSDPKSSMGNGQVAFWWDGTDMWLVYKQGSAFKVKLSYY